LFFLLNRLKKGCAYHLDLFVVGILNGFLSIYGFPWMHGVLPHSPLHLRSLADVEERVDGGHVYEMYVTICSVIIIIPFSLCEWNHTFHHHANLFYSSHYSFSSIHY